MAENRQVTGRKPFQEGIRNPFSEEASAVTRDVLGNVNEALSPSSVFSQSEVTSEDMFGKPESELNEDENMRLQLRNSLDFILAGVLGGPAAGAAKGASAFQQGAKTAAKRFGGSVDDWLKVFSDPGQTTQATREAAQRVAPKVVKSGQRATRSGGATSQAARSTSGQLPQAAPNTTRAAGAEGLPALRQTSMPSIVPKRTTSLVSQQPSPAASGGSRAFVQNARQRAGTARGLDPTGRGTPQPGTSAASGAAKGGDEAAQAATQGGRQGLTLGSLLRGTGKAAKYGVPGYLGVRAITDPTGLAEGTQHFFGEGGVERKEDESLGSYLGRLTHTAGSNMANIVSNAFEPVGDFVGSALTGTTEEEPGTDPRVLINKANQEDLGIGGQGQQTGVPGAGGPAAAGAGGQSAETFPFAGMQEQIANRRDQQQGQLDNILNQLSGLNADLSSADDMPSAEEVKRRRQAILDAFDMARPEGPDLTTMLTGAAGGAQGTENAAQTLLGAAAGSGQAIQQAEQQEQQFDLQRAKLQNELQNANLQYRQQLSQMKTEDAARQLQQDMKKLQTRLDVLNAKREGQMGMGDLLDLMGKKAEVEGQRIENMTNLRDAQGNPRNATKAGDIALGIHQGQFGDEILAEAVSRTLKSSGGIIDEEKWKAAPLSDKRRIYKDALKEDPNFGTRVINNIMPVINDNPELAQKLVNELGQRKEIQKRLEELKEKEEGENNG